MSEISGGQAVTSEKLTPAIRFAQGMAVTARANGRPGERDWLDMLALLERAAAEPEDVSTMDNARRSFRARIRRARAEALREAAAALDDDDVAVEVALGGVGYVSGFLEGRALVEEAG